MVTGQRSGFLNAFAAEISSVVPTWVKTMFLGHPWARPLVFDTAVKTISQKNGKIHLPATLLHTDEKGITPVKDQIVDVILPEEELLRREITIPEKLLSKADKIVSLDTIQKTPFKPADIYSATQLLNKHGQDTTVVQWISRRDHIEAIRARLARLGLRVRQVQIESNPSVTITDFSGEVAPRARAWRRVNAVLLLAAVVLMGGWFLAPSWTAYQTLKMQEVVNRTLSQETLALRESVDDLQGGASERTAFVERVSRHQTISSVLRDLTILMPDEVWLTDISIQRGRMLVRGSTAASAAELVLNLTRDQRFIAPRLTGPISQTADGRERFDLTLDLKSRER